MPDSEPGIDLPGAIDLGPAIEPSLTILVAFPLSHSSELSQFLSELSSPKSPLYHQYLTQSEFDAEYGGAASPYASAVLYFQSFGVSDMTTSADRLVITFQATSVQVEEIFHTRIHSFTSAGHSYYAPVGRLELPGPLAGAVSTVEGLSSYSAFVFHTLGGRSAEMFRAPPAGFAPPPSAAQGYLEPATINGVQYEFAPDFQVAYDEQSLFAEAGYPTNMVIATILVGGCTSTASPCPTGNLTAPFYPKDIYDFYNETMPAGQPHASVSGVNLYGAEPPGASAQYDV
ncbi:MAG: protease pro-enzyme activation domain-containing protein, partial [Thermoplasmata archaeon]